MTVLSYISVFLINIIKVIYITLKNYIDLPKRKTYLPKLIIMFYYIESNSYDMIHNIVTLLFIVIYKSIKEIEIEI